MPSEFDPYHKWLGITPDQRPIDHYLLLGLNRFEGDQGKISAAADKRMAAIRKLQTGPRAALTQRLLNELSRAKLCLTDPDARAAYDEMLRGMDAADGDSSGHDGLPTINVHQDRKVTRTPVAPRIRAVPYYRRVWFPALAAGGIVAVALGVWYVGDQLRRRSPQPPVERPPTRPAPPVDSRTPTDPIRVVTVEQETSGAVRLLPALAVLSGDSLRLEAATDTDVLVGWEAPGASATWEFRLFQLPPRQLFRAQVTYRAGVPGYGMLRLGSAEVPFRFLAAQQDTDLDLLISVSQVGVHRLVLQTPEGATLQLRSLVLSFP